MDGTIVTKRDQRRGLRAKPSASPDAGRRSGNRVNTLFVLGLWGLLWFGYNTSNAYVERVRELIRPT